MIIRGSTTSADAEAQSLYHLIRRNDSLERHKCWKIDTEGGDRDEIRLNVINKWTVIELPEIIEPRAQAVPLFLGCKVFSLVLNVTAKYHNKDACAKC